MFFTDVDGYVDFLCKHNMSADQFLFLFMIHSEDYKNLYKYVTLNHGLPPEQIHDLISRGFMLNNNSTSKEGEPLYFADSFIVTEKFTGPVFMEPLTEEVQYPAEEFYNAFPDYIYVNGKRFHARNVEKFPFMMDYMRKVGFSKVRHRKAMEGLEYGKRNDLINVGLDKFFKTEQWMNLYKEMNITKESKRYGDNEF
jgi:hypothetical protein